jgi:hypothetical protein
MGSIGLTVTKLHTKQSLKVELKNSVRTSPPGTVLDLSGNRLELVQSTQNCVQFLFKTEPFLPSIDSWATRHKMEWNLGTRVTSTQETSSQRGFSQIQIFPFWFWMTSKNLGFRGNKRNPPNWMGYSHAFNPRLEADDEPHPSTWTHRRNRRKTSQIVR